ncbi:MAG: hypothetical protein AMJ65_17935 [Phycisphaerae bacterium SG8_4]|nr:MAG: hypothetical protein AMJ65_17935 [Phycisphaerae bacterium SG8_4]
MDRKRMVMLTVAAIVCCTIVLAGKNLAQPIGGQRGMRWEYSVYQSRKQFARRGVIGKIDEVDQFGQQGWELVSVFESEGMWTYWFKRPK